MADWGLLINGLPLSEAEPLPEGTWVEFRALPPTGAELRLELVGTLLEPFLHPGDPVWNWRWLAPASPGIHTLTLRSVWPDGRSELLRAELRIAPRKLDQERYILLLTDLQRLGRSLIFALHGGVAEVSLQRDPAPPTVAEELQLLCGDALVQLEAAVRRLAQLPPERRHGAPTMVEPGQLRNFSALHQLRPELRTSAELPPAIDAIAALPEPTTVLSYDSYEARLLRRLLAELAERTATLANHPHLPRATQDQIAEARARIRRMQAQPWLAEVVPLDRYRGATLRLRHDANYRVVYRLWRRILQRPLINPEAAISSPPLSDLPRLYERWCALRVATTLLNLPGWVAQEAGTPSDEGDWLLALPEDQPLLILTQPGGAQLCLRYQPRYRPLQHQGSGLGSLDRHTRIPDLALELTRPNMPPQLLVLDAKYRLDATGGLPAEALGEAYSYLGAIGNGSGRACLGAALLYPGEGSAAIYTSGVAALPLLPGITTAPLVDWIGARLSDG